MVDLRKRGPPKWRPKTTIYIGRHVGRAEFWLPYDRFERLAGGKAEANDLKAKLEARGIIVTEGQGANKKYVVKRMIPGMVPRQRFVALRMKAQLRTLSSATGQQWR